VDGVTTKLQGKASPKKLGGGRAGVRERGKKVHANGDQKQRARKSAKSTSHHGGRKEKAVVGGTLGQRTMPSPQATKGKKHGVGRKVATHTMKNRAREGSSSKKRRRGRADVKKIEEKTALKP